MSILSECGYYNLWFVYFLWIIFLKYASNSVIHIHLIYIVLYTLQNLFLQCVFFKLELCDTLFNIDIVVQSSI